MRRVRRIKKRYIGIIIGLCIGLLAWGAVASKGAEPKGTSYSPVDLKIGRASCRERV